jgi:hypothetical protein
MIDYIGEIRSVREALLVIQEANIQKGPIPHGYNYYRGHGDSNYQLRSSLSRYFTEVGELIDTEEKLIINIKSKVEQSDLKTYFRIPNNHILLDPDWFWLAQAQHLGIPTRLLDWSLSIEVALFFAVSDQKNIKYDADLWVFFIDDQFNLYNQDLPSSQINPFRIEKDLFLNIPIQWNENYVRNEPQRNILSQQGKFFIRIFSNSFIPLEEDSNLKKNLYRFRINSLNKPLILEQLRDLGYTKKTIFKTYNKSLQKLKREMLDFIMSRK